MAVTSEIVPSLALSNHGPCLVGDIIILYGAIFTKTIAAHNGATALAPHGCVSLLGTGYPQTFITRDELDRMSSVGAASVACERKCTPCSWSGIGESAPLQTSTRISPSVQLFRTEEPTCSLAVWARVVPPSVMQHAVPLGRDSWTRFTNRTSRSLPPRASEDWIYGELELSHYAPAGMRAYAVNPVASGGGCHLCYDGSIGVTNDKPKLLAVNLNRSNGSQAVTGPTSSWTCSPSLTCHQRKNTLSPLGDS